MISLLVLTAFRQDADPLARYMAFRSAHPTVEMSVTSSVNGKQNMAGDIAIQAPKRFIFKAKWAGYDYSLASSEKDYVEIERSGHVYDDQLPTAKLIAFASDINSTANSAIPRFLFLNNFKAEFPSKGLVVTKKAGFDEAYVKVSGPQGSVIEYWLDIDSEGKILMLRQHSKSPMGQSTRQWNLSNYRYPNFGLSAFITPLPLGYTPHSIPRLGAPLQIGHAAPVSGWMSSNGGNRGVDFGVLAGHKPFLIAVLEADSTPSKSARASLPAISSKLPVFIVGPGGYHDNSGKLMAQLSVPATPMFYLIDAAGKVKRLWMGYDPAQAHTFEQDVIQSATGQGATK